MCGMCVGDCATCCHSNSYTNAIGKDEYYRQVKRLSEFILEVLRSFGVQTTQLPYGLRTNQGHIAASGAIVLGCMRGIPTSFFTPAGEYSFVGDVCFNDASVSEMHQFFVSALGLQPTGEMPQGGRSVFLVTRDENGRELLETTIIHLEPKHVRISPDVALRLERKFDLCPIWHWKYHPPGYLAPLDTELGGYDMLARRHARTIGPRSHTVISLDS
jgi:hypothetical protein